LFLEIHDEVDVRYYVQAMENIDKNIRSMDLLRYIFDIVVGGVYTLHFKNIIILNNILDYK
jgi:hypothetical protein